MREKMRREVFKPREKKREEKRREESDMIFSKVIWGFWIEREIKLHFLLGSLERNGRKDIFDKNSL